MTYWVINSLRDLMTEGKLIWKRCISVQNNQQLATRKQNQLSKKSTSGLENRVSSIISIINIPCPLPLQHSCQSWLRCLKAFKSRKLPHSPKAILLIDPTIRAPMHKINMVAHRFIAAFVVITVVKKAIALQAALGQ